MTIYGIQQESNAERKQHPSTMWSKWKSDDKAFKHYDKEAWVEEVTNLPEEFIVVAEWHSVGWYVNALSTWVRSNEIFDFNDPLIVRKNNWEMYLKGKWKDISESVKNVWAKLQKHIHYTSTGSLELWTLVMSWAAVSSWIDAISRDKTIDPARFKVKIAEIKEWKKGKITYSYPVFANWSKLDSNDINLQKAMAKSLVDYNSDSKQAIADEIAEKKKEEENLPF